MYYNPKMTVIPKITRRLAWNGTQLLALWYPLNDEYVDRAARMLVLTPSLPRWSTPACRLPTLAICAWQGCSLEPPRSYVRLKQCGRGFVQRVSDGGAMGVSFSQILNARK